MECENKNISLEINLINFIFNFVYIAITYLFIMKYYVISMTPILKKSFRNTN